MDLSQANLQGLFHQGEGFIILLHLVYDQNFMEEQGWWHPFNPFPQYLQFSPLSTPSFKLLYERCFNDLSAPPLPHPTSNISHGHPYLNHHSCPHERFWLYRIVGWKNQLCYWVEEFFSGQTDKETFHSERAADLDNFSVHFSSKRAFIYYQVPSFEIQANIFYESWQYLASL